MPTPVNSWKSIPWHVRFRMWVHAHYYTLLSRYILGYKAEGASHEYTPLLYKRLKFNKQVAQMFVDMYCEYCLGFKNHKRKKKVTVRDGLPFKDRRFKVWINGDKVDIKDLGGLYARDSKTIWIPKDPKRGSYGRWAALLHECAHINHHNHGYQFSMELSRVGEFSAMLYRSLKEWENARLKRKEAAAKRRHR